MGTNYIAPTWRMPENANKDRLSNYSLDLVDGNSEKINFPTKNFAGSNGTVSYSYWIKPDSFSDHDYGYILSNSSGGNTGGLAINEGGSGGGGIPGSIYYYNGTGAPGIYVISTAMTPGTWYHVVNVFDIGGEIRTYINSNLDKTTTNVATPYKTTWDTMFRYSDNANPHYVSGSFSEFSIFDYALTDGTNGTVNQIEYLYNLNNPMAITGAKPVAYWPLGDNSNPITTAGYPNISVGADSVFNFNSDYIEVDPIVKEFDSDNFSISAWVNFDTLPSGTTEMKIYNELGSANRYISLTTRGSQPTILFRYGNNNNYYLYGTTTITTNRWYHVAVTYSTTDGIKLYLDNNEENTASYLALARSAHGYASIGAYFYAGSASNYLDGKISNMQLWDVALTSSNIETLYHNGQPLMTGAQPQQSNLRAWYKLNQSANWEADTIGNWQIPDNRSAFPQSFKFLASEKVIIDENFFTLTGTNKMQVCTISFWAKITNAGYKAVLGFSSAANWSLRVFQGNMWFISGGNNYIKWLNVSQGIDLQDGKWHHCLMTIPTADNKNDCNLFLDGLKMSNVVPTFRTNHGAVGGGTGNPMGRLSVGGAHPADISGINISNVQVWLNTALSDSDTLLVYNNGVPLPSDSIQSRSEALFYFDKATSAWDGTTWNFENQIYPTNWKSAYYSGADAGMLRDDDSKPAYSNQVFSMSVWVKPRPGAATNGDIFACKGSSWQGVMLGYIGNDLQFQIGDKNTTAVDGGGSSKNGNWSYFENRVDNASPNYTPYGEWSHIVVVWNGTDSKFYINESLVKTVTPPSSLTIDYGQSPNNSSFGGRNDANASYFDGTISNFAYWSSEIDQTAVTALYNNGNPEASISQSPNHWFTLKDFGEGTVDKIGDLDYNNRYQDTGIEFVDTFVSIKEVTGLNMVEANLVENNASTVNGESSGMNTTNLVQSNLTRKQPFSSYSIDFDAASSDYIDCGNVSSLNWGTGNGSISCWFKTTQNVTGAVDLVINGGFSTGGKNYALFLDDAEKLGFAIDDGNDNPFVKTTSSVADGNWHHAVGTREDGNIKIYLDGSLINSTTDTTDTSIDSTDPLIIGAGMDADTGVVGNFFDGLLSNASIFDKALSEDDVLNLYNNGVPQDLSNFRITPVAWYPMDQSYTYFNGSVLVARDVISGIDGTGVNIIQENIVGNAPGSDFNGTGANLTMADLKGDMQDSTNNSYSINMADYADGVTNPANSGRSTIVP